MAKDGLTNSPFENPACPTPGGGDGTISGTPGGWDLGPGSQSETPNSQSGLRVQPQTVDGLQDAPAPGAHVEIADGVTSPKIPVMRIDQKGVGS
jgi:hypothetical protein